MNILVVANNFTNGGFEKHIENYNKYLKGKISFVYAFGHYEENNYLKGCKKYSISNEPTLQALYDNINCLVDIIRKEKIDAIHVHPFTCVFPAIFASQLTGVPIFYTVHGFASLNGYYSLNDEILFRYFLSDLKPLVFSVSKEYFKTLEYKYMTSNYRHLPNSMDSSKFSKIECVKNNKWLLISRLDEDKKGEIIELFKNFKDLKIELDIVGDGTCRKELEKLAKKLKISSIVNFKGRKSDIAKELEVGYNGVIGLGQVVLEGLMSNLPVLLIGYGKITGLVDKELYGELKDINFVNRFFDSRFDLDEFLNINDNIEKYQLRDIAKNDFDIKNAVKIYYDAIKELKFTDSMPLKKVYRDLEEKIKDENVGTELMIDSVSFFNILQEDLLRFIADPDLRSCFHHKQILYLHDIIDRQQTIIGELQYQLDSFKDNVGLRTIIKNTTKHLHRKNK